MQHVHVNLLKYVFEQIFITKQKKIKMGNYRNMFTLQISYIIRACKIKALDYIVRLVL